MQPKPIVLKAVITEEGLDSAVSYNSDLSITDVFSEEKWKAIIPTYKARMWDALGEDFHHSIKKYYYPDIKRHSKTYPNMNLSVLEGVWCVEIVYTKASEIKWSRYSDEYRVIACNVMVVDDGLLAVTVLCKR